MYDLTPPATICLRFFHNPHVCLCKYMFYASPIFISLSLLFLTLSLFTTTSIFTTHQNQFNPPLDLSGFFTPSSSTTLLLYTAIHIPLPSLSIFLSIYLSIFLL
ncbi:hypothetical protein S83_013924 [Arachis hypogaea]